MCLGKKRIDYVNDALTINGTETPRQVWVHFFAMYEAKRYLRRIKALIKVSLTNSTIESGDKG